MQIEVSGALLNPSKNLKMNPDVIMENLINFMLVVRTHPVGFSNENKKAIIAFIEDTKNSEHSFLSQANTRSTFLLYG